MNRRDLIRQLAAGSVTLFVVPTFLTSCEKETIDPNGNPDPDPDPDPDELTIDLGDDKYSSLLPVGGSYVESGIIIFHTADGYLALSSICTHQSCQVDYDHDVGNLPCPCHGSIFSTTGSVLQGPAVSPLKKYTLTQEGDILTVVL